MRSRTIPILLATAAFSLLLAMTARAAEAKHHRFVGEHPAQGGVFCHIHAPHVHVYAPVKADVLYRQHDGWNYFVGDPVAHGYAGPKYAYDGAHPIHVDAALGDEGDDVTYCYLKGPHYHVVAPPPDTHFELRGDIYWYVGEFPPVFVQERPKLARINVVYAPMVYARPVVLLGPPPHWHDVLIDVDVRGGAVVEAPVVETRAVGVVGAGVHAGVEVHVPVPTFQMSVGIGAAPVVVQERRDVIYVHDHDHKHKHKHKNGRALGHRKGKGHW